VRLGYRPVSGLGRGASGKGSEKSRGVDIVAIGGKQYVRRIMKGIQWPKLTVGLLFVFFFLQFLVLFFGGADTKADIS